MNAIALNIDSYGFTELSDNDMMLVDGGSWFQAATEVVVGAAVTTVGVFTVGAGVVLCGAGLGTIWTPVGAGMFAGGAAAITGGAALIYTGWQIGTGNAGSLIFW